MKLITEHRSGILPLRCQGTPGQGTNLIGSLPFFHARRLLDHVGVSGAPLVEVEAFRGRPSGPSTKVLGYFPLPLRGTLAERAEIGRRRVKAFVPEGHSIIAQRFIAGLKRAMSHGRRKGVRSQKCEAPSGAGNLQDSNLQFLVEQLL